MKSITLKQRNEIREKYKDWYPRSCPYRYFDWSSVFSPIEENVWGDIRYIGIPFYPQYPILEYFVDFADPVKKIAIECDGKEFHQDKEKDRIRQERIEAEGWEFIRFEGKDTYKCYDDFFPEYKEFSEREREELMNRYKKTSEGILRQLKYDRYIVYNDK
jgi:very-short-patch-repair endonuclease